MNQFIQNTKKMLALMAVATATLQPTMSKENTQPVRANSDEYMPSEHTPEPSYSLPSRKLQTPINQSRSTSKKSIDVPPKMPDKDGIQIKSIKAPIQKAERTA